MTMVSEATRMDRANFYKLNRPHRNMTQCEATIDYLNMFGSITPLEALNAFGCFRLGARVSDLRERGYNIRTDINQEGIKRYAIYSYEEGNDEIQSND